MRDILGEKYKVSFVKGTDIKPEHVYDDPKYISKMLENKFGAVKVIQEIRPPKNAPKDAIGWRFKVKDGTFLDAWISLQNNIHLLPSKTGTTRMLCELTYRHNRGEVGQMKVMINPLKKMSQILIADKLYDELALSPTKIRPLGKYSTPDILHLPTLDRHKSLHLQNLKVHRHLERSLRKKL